MNKESQLIRILVDLQPKCLVKFAGETRTYECNFPNRITQPRNDAYEVNETSRNPFVFGFFFLKLATAADIIAPHSGTMGHKCGVFGIIVEFASFSNASE